MHRISSLALASCNLGPPTAFRSLRRPSSTASGLRSSRVALRKRFGQHLLKNADVVKNIVALAAVQPHETVFEIGPGTGNMTVHLVKDARMLYAVELDRDMHRMVLARIKGLGCADRFQCVCGDFLAVPLPPFDVLCANIPYQISSPVLDRLLFHRPLPRRAIIMFQLEFAQRCVARPGTSTYCRLSVNCALLCASVRLVMRVNRDQFRPPPKVDSGVVEFVPRAPPHPWLRRPGELGQWDAFLRLAFASKNKTLRSLFGGSKPLLVTLTVLREGGRAKQRAHPRLAVDSLPAGDTLLRAAAGTCLRSEATATRRELLAAIASVVPGSVDLDDGGDPHNEATATFVSTDDATAALGVSDEPVDDSVTDDALEEGFLEGGSGEEADGPLLSARPNALPVEDLLAVFLRLRSANFGFPVAAQRLGLGAAAVGATE